MTLEQTKKKNTVRISKKDLLKLLSDNDHMTNQITDLQIRMNEMQEEIRTLKSQEAVQAPTEEVEIKVKGLTPDKIKEIKEILKDRPRAQSHHPFHRNDVYYDGKRYRSRFDES